jgi:capsular exopolysaccharide synthesis family protein
MAAAEAQSRFQQIKAVLNPQGQDTANVDWSKLETLSQVLNSHLIQTLRTQEITVSAQVAELSEKYGPLHPKLAHMKAELQDLRQRIQQEVRKIYDSVRHELNMAVAQHRAVKEAIGRYNADKIRIEHSEVEHSMLEREVESNQHLYDMFLKTTKETDLSAGMSMNNIYLADPATVSAMPARPQKKLNVMLSLLSGLMMGVGLAIVLERRGKKLRAPADLERYIPNVSLLGVVPLIANGTNGDKSLIHPHAMTPAAESYRIIRTSLLLSRPDTLPYRVLITSPGENEGKTTLAINLAMTMAQLDNTKVILVDMDFRNPDKHPIYNVQGKNKTSKGLVHYLRGEASLHELLHSGFSPNFSIIPSGDRPKNPTELLHSQALAQFLDWAKKNEYHVIIDCPPVLPIADAAVVASKVDGVLMVVSAGETTREAYRSAIQRIAFSGGKIVGVVLQKARATEAPYYYYGSTAQTN